MPDHPAAVPGPELRRAVSRPLVLGLAVNDVVGSGVYLLPAVATALLGAASLAAVAVAGVAVLAIVLCFAEASSHYDRPGGAYLYAREAFGEFVGFEVGWMTWLARVASVSSLAVGFSVALGHVWPAAGDGFGRAAAIAVPLLALTAINVAGVGAGAKTAVALVTAKMVPLALFLAAGLAAFSPETFAGQGAAPPAPGSTPLSRLGEAALLLMFAYAGFENTTAPAGEYRRPQRDVPFALVTQLGLVTAIYFAVQLVAMGTLPDLAASETPLADAAAGFLGPWGGWLLTVGAAASILGTNSNSVLAGPRYLFALARDGFGPAFLGRVHPHWRTPALAIVVQTAIALPLAFSGTFTGLAALSIVARLTTYLGTALAVPVLRRKLPAEPGGFRLPGGPAIPVVAAVLTLALAASTTRTNLVAAGVALAVGAGIYALRRKEAQAKEAG